MLVTLKLDGCMKSGKLLICCFFIKVFVELNGKYFLVIYSYKNTEHLFRASGEMEGNIDKVYLLIF